MGWSKTEAGRGRTVPLNATTLKALQGRATNFPDRKPEYFVFAAERYGLAEDDARLHGHSMDPTKQAAATWVAAA
jgi:hypothetical protein